MVIYTTADWRVAQVVWTLQLQSSSPLGNKLFSDQRR